MTALCPSSRCQEGALLLGIVLGDGRVAFAKDRIVVNRDFVENARSGSPHPPETRFRFGSPCASGACKQWTGSRCGVIDGVVEETRQAGYQPTAAELPECSIRSQCRWYGQAGAQACGVCDLVVTDSRI